MLPLESEMLWRVVIAAVLGTVLGLERSLSGKHAGMRTYALVTLGASLFTATGIIASFQYSAFVGVSPLALAGFVVVGVGFIGAGLSSIQGEHRELTTASGIWVAAGVGVAAGFGLFKLAVGATVLGILIFSVLAKIEHRLRVHWGGTAE